MAGTSPDADGAGLGPGSRIASYRLEAQAGAGGMAVVYRARDERLGRAVALKVIAPGLAADPGFRQRFIRESRAAAAVDHPHILPVYEAGEAGGQLFIAMRYVSGGDLRTIATREGPLPAGRAAGFIAAAASALDAAHAAGLVHRDVKPANMLIDSRPGQPDHLYLSDFGLSKGTLSAASLSLTGSAEVFGTPDYLAPEQASGAAVDSRSDQYALACAAYVLLAGVPVFVRDHPMAVLLAHMSAPPPSLTALRPDLPPAADQVLARALAKAPGDRYGSCIDFAAALTGALGLGSRTSNAVGGIQPDGAGQLAAAQAAVDQVPSVTAARLSPHQPEGPARPHGPVGGLGGPAVTAGITAPARLAAATQPPYRRRMLASARRRAGMAAVAAIVVIVAAAAFGLIRHQHPSNDAGRTLRPTPTAPTAPSSPPPDVTTSAPPQDVSGPYPKAKVAAILGDYGNTPEDAQWDPTAQLNEVAGELTAAADGVTTVFFFFDGAYIGADTPDGSASVKVTRLSSTEFLLVYPLYSANDPRCCPTGGSASVRFSWTGRKLVALDPIPTESQRN